METKYSSTLAETDERSRSVLAVDTSSNLASVAYGSSSELASDRQAEVTTHSEGLVQLIDDVLNDAKVHVKDIGTIVCGAGPGSFTGLRIGLATAKGLCMAGGIPLVRIPSTDAIAVAVQGVADRERLCCVLLNAGRNEIFCQLYRGTTPSENWKTDARDKIAQRVEGIAQKETSPMILVGSAIAEDPTSWASISNVTIAGSNLHQVSARHLLGLVANYPAAVTPKEIAAIEPLYFRAPDIRNSKSSQRRSSKIERTPVGN